MNHMPAGLLIAIAFVYVIPWLIAAGRGHHNTAAIAALNLLTGWFYGLGWVLALVWALTKVEESGEAAPGDGDQDSQYFLG